MKAFKLKFSFKLLAIIDILFAERFELKLFKDGRPNGSTKYCAKEIDEAGKSGKL